MKIPFTERRATLLAALEQGEQSLVEGRAVPYSPALMQNSVERAKRRYKEALEAAKND